MSLKHVVSVLVTVLFSFSFSSFFLFPFFFFSPLKILKGNLGSCRCGLFRDKMQHSEADALEGALRHQNKLCLMYIYLKKVSITHALYKSEVKH